MQSPIFLTGPGRSGTTICNYTLALHPEIVSINSWYSRSRKPMMNFLGEKVRRVRLLRSNFGEKKGFPLATEPLQLWRDGFSNFWDIVNNKDELSTEETNQFKAQLASIMALESSNKVLMTKMTGPPFNHLLKQVYPTSKIVWIDRDPIAVVMSFVKRGWVGASRISADEVKKMSKKEKIIAGCERYNHFHELRIKEEFDYILYYENVIADPIAEFKRCTEALDLSWSKGFENSIRGMKISNNRNKQYDLSPEELDLLNELLETPLNYRSFS